MILSLVRLELAILRRDRRAWWSLLALAALVLLSFGAIASQAHRANAEKQAVSAAERARWVGQGEKDPHSAAHYSIFAFKPSPALAPLDPGVEPFVGQSVWLEAHHQNDMLYRPQQNASLLQRIGFASPSALITGFGPLIIFLLAFTLVAQDRERGTMRLALGAAVHPRAIVMSKAVAVWSAAAGLLVVPVTLAALAWAVLGGALGADLFWRALVWTGIMASYLALLSAVGIALSLWLGNARLALTGLFGLWILFALALPRVASGTVEAARPLPSSQAVRQQLAEEAPTFWSDEQAARNRALLLRRHGVSRIEDIPNPRMAELDLMERHSHAVFDRVLGGFYAKVASQDRLFATLGFLSPTIAAQAASASAAGTDFSHHRDFIDVAERYRRDLVNRMNSDGMAHRAHGAERHTNDQSLWSQVPTFAYPPPALGNGSSSALPAYAALLAWLVAAAILLAIVSRRLRP
ncbi:ABC transporter permease subunit [Sphingosinicella terrae]|uniref:ABC transporter permease subunit n=1 Tax=Sphingosinicella terrae TaxID=2172047 RepID=UPI000E0DFABE|nr:ABC transporter permease subunit [Sphingosinicella terrae]